MSHPGPLVVKGTDYISSYKSNYHTTVTAPFFFTWVNQENDLSELESFNSLHHHLHMEFTFHNIYIIQYSECLDRTQPLTQKLLTQSYVAPRLKSSIHKFYGCHHDTFGHNEIFISQITMDLFLFTQIFFFLYHRQDFYQIWLYTWVTRTRSMNC